MIIYKDKTFCSSNVPEHTCGREMTKAEEINAGASGLPVAYANFCGSQKEGL